MDEDESRKSAWRKVCTAVVIVLVVVFFVGGVGIWLAFKDSIPPIFKVQHLVVPTFDVNNNTDNQVVLAVDLRVRLESYNFNNMVGTKLQNMIMQVRCNEYRATLGETKVHTITQHAATRKMFTVETQGKAQINKTTLTADEVKLDLSLSGEVIYTFGPFDTYTYPFTVACHNITTTTNESICGTLVYSEKINVNQDQRTMPYPESMAPTMSVAEGPFAETSPSSNNKTASSVQLVINRDNVILDNGILAVTIKKPDGFIYEIQYNGISNILDAINPEDDRGYWDVVWAPAGKKGTKGKFDRLKGTIFRVITDEENHIEISFSRTYDPAKNGVPLDIDMRYIMLRGESGLYSYNILNRGNWPGCNIPNARLAFKLSRAMFRHLIIGDDKQRKMPLPEDRMKGRGQVLQYPEAVKLTDPIDQEFKGEVDDKYQYSDESHNIKVHGWRSSDPLMGFWQITPSYEFRIGGPNKQFLTSHVGPSVLAMFVSAHYSGEHVIPKFKDGEPWNKILGPVFIYLNKIDKGQNPKLLWEDAKKKMLKEEDAWPYDFVASEDFAQVNQRSNVSGRLFVRDTFINDGNIPANGSFVGLATPGEAGSWQIECKGYQFWTTTNTDGSFIIENVRTGNYNLYGWIPGFIGDYRYNFSIEVNIGHNIDLGDIIYQPPRNGPTLWEIGEADRTAKEFFIPDPNPNYVNKLYVNHHEKFRQYGLWERYDEIYPNEDLIYVVNSSDYHKDWFYAQVTRKADKKYNGTTWQIKFNLNEVNQVGVYKLRLSIASATNAQLQVRVNEPNSSLPIFEEGQMGNDNAIARHGIHGLYWLFSIDVLGNTLKVGENTIYLTQTKSKSPFQGIMYDYIRLESPSSVAPGPE